MSENAGDSQIPPFDGPAIYELRVEGRLGPESAAWFADTTLAIDETSAPVQTIIRAAIRDDAALYGLISRIRDLGLSLLAVRRLEKNDPRGLNVG
jgi:hypothetical protein